MSPHSAGLSPANNVSPSGKGHGSSTQQQQQQPFQIPLFHQYPEKQHFTFVIPPNTNNTSSSSSTSASTSSSEVSTTSTTINDSTALNDTKDSSTDKPDELQSNTRSKLEMLREKDTNIKPPSNQPFKKVPLQWKLDNITEEVETRCVEEVCYDEDGKKYSKKKIRRLLQIPRPVNQKEIEFQDIFFAQPEIINATQQVQRVENSKKKLHSLIKKTREKTPSPTEVKQFQKEWNEIEGDANQAASQLQEQNEKLGDLIKEVQRLFPNPDTSLTAESLGAFKAACDKFSGETSS